jgi:Mrp family chromosome partitioning ATPase
VSRPPALDPDAERWAASFDAVPGEPKEAPPEEPPKQRPARWKTQVMGSMVPLEVSAAREERAPMSEQDSLRVQEAPLARPLSQIPVPAASTIVEHGVPPGWSPSVDSTSPHVLALRDAVLARASCQRLCIAVTGGRGAERPRIAAGLALALAQSGPSVLLLEGDFDQPALHDVLSIAAPVGAGFSQQIVARRQNGQNKPWVVVRAAATLHVMTEGRLRSPGSLASNEFERALLELGEQHHIVIIHAPPLSRSAELRVLRGLVQAVVVADPTRGPELRVGEAMNAVLV